MTAICKVTAHILVISRIYLDTANERTLIVEGLTIDDRGTRQHIQAEWSLRREQIGLSSVLADASLGALLELCSAACAFEPHISPESVRIYLREPEYTEVAPTALPPELLDLMYDALDNCVGDEEIYDDVYINDECMHSSVTREDLLQAIANSWGGSRWYRIKRTQGDGVKQMANTGHLGFKTMVCLDGMDDDAMALFKSMAKRVEAELRAGVKIHPDWFRLTPEGPTVHETMAEYVQGLNAPIEVLSHRCDWHNYLLAYPADAYALVTDRDSPWGWIVPPVEVPGGSARHSMLLSFTSGSGLNVRKSTALVLFSPGSPLSHVAMAIEDVSKAYLFPEAIAMNDYYSMGEALAWDSCIYSMHEFDLRWGGLASVAQEVKTALTGKSNTLAVLSFPMDGFGDEMVETLNHLTDICNTSLLENALLLVSCSLNVLHGRKARLSLFARLPEDEDD